MPALTSIVVQSQSWADCLRRLGYKTTCRGQTQTLKNVVTEFNISTSHFLGQPTIQRNAHAKRALDMVSVWLRNDSGFIPVMKGWQMSLKRPIVRWLFARAGNKCESCSWSVLNNFTKKIPLQIHHIDGMADNNRPENLKVLCPNCHSLTENFGHRNQSKRIYRYASKVKIE